jgi:DNA modification methylase
VIEAIEQTTGKDWTLFHGDSCETMRGLPDSSIHLSIHSPPYLGLFQYSATPRDISNSRDDGAFWEHYRFVIAELFRVMKPGRIACVDLMNVPSMLSRDGVIGLKDFRGDVIRAYTEAGFVWHSEHCIFKCPLIEATRTKSLGLMHGQLVKDSAMSRAGIPQYLEAFRKPGQNAEPITHDSPLKWYGEDQPTHGNLSHENWRRYASPIWSDISFTRTLNAKAARDGDDERHICPMSLDIIDRALELWSNPGDVVLDPFNGIGSTGHCALGAGRKYVGIELKTSYYQQAVRNLQAVVTSSQTDMFAEFA